MKILLIRNVLGSIGDEAMLRADHERLQRSFPDAEVHVLTDDPDYWRSRYGWSADYSDFLFVGRWHRSFGKGPSSEDGSGNRSTTWNVLLRFLANHLLKWWVVVQRKVFLFNVKRLRTRGRIYFLPRPLLGLLERISSSNVIFGGGWLLPEKKEFLWSRLTLYKAVQILAKPLILNGQHIPELRNSRERQELAGILRSACCISIRDRGHSESRLEAFGVVSTKIHRGIDPAMFLKPASEKQVDAFLRSCGASLGGPVLLGVNMNVLNRNMLSRLRDLYKTVCTRLAEELDVHYIFFGMQKYATVDEENEMRFLSRSLPSRVRYSLLPFRLDASLLKGVLGRMVAVISSRYHPIVFAFGSTIPAVGIATSEHYEEKLSGIFDIFDMQRFLLRFPENSEEEVLCRLREINEHSGDLRSFLSRRLIELQPLGEGPMRVIRERVRDNSKESQ